MKCAKVKRLLGRYIDKELRDEKQIALLEEHLKICVGCQKELGSLLSLRGMIAQKEKIKAQENFLAKLQNKIQGEAEIIKIKWLPQAGDLARRLIPVPVVAAALMFALLFTQLNGVSSVDEYLLADLSSEEIAIIGGYIDNSDLLREVVFRN